MEQMFALDTAATLVIIIPLTITSLTGSIVAIISALKTSSIDKRTVNIEDQVTTINGRSLAQLGDATETRRIEEVPPKERSAADVQHLKAVPDPASPNSSASPNGILRSKDDPTHPE